MHKRTTWLLLCFLGATAGFWTVVRLPVDLLLQEHLADVIISEVAWSGTAASGSDEWIELHNRGHTAVTLAGWHLTSNSLNIPLTGSIPPQGFFLLERGDDDTVIDIPASLIYIGGLADTGEAIELRNSDGILVDSANGNGGEWPAGTADPDYQSMERIDPSYPDLDENWQDNSMVIRNGHDADGNPLNGTPMRPNSPWTNLPDEADLVLSKTGPSTVYAGHPMAYTLLVGNEGNLEASSTLLTDTLPVGFHYLEDNSGFPVSQPYTGTLVWQVGGVPTDTTYTFNLTVTVDPWVIGPAINTAWIATPVTETVTYNNLSMVTTNVITSGSPLVLIDAVYYDGYELNEPDEAVRLINVGRSPASMEGWVLSDGISSVIFPENSMLGPGQSAWMSKSGTAFRIQFGYLPDYEALDTEPEVPNLAGTWPGFSNEGDEVILMDGSGQRVDVLVYEAGNPLLAGWNGTPLNPYTVSGVFAEEGQILYRKLDTQTGRPISDTDTAMDWAQDIEDVINGRKVQYPGWDLEQFFFTHQVTEAASVAIAIAPDNAYGLVEREISKAQISLDIATYTFRNISLGNALVAAAGRGVSVTVLLEGSPSGGLDNQEKYICKMLEEAGGQCWFMINDPAQDIYDRYRNYHAKYLIIDNNRVIVSTENLSPDSLPDDDKGDGTWGRRGVLLFTTAPSVVSHLQTIWEVDFDPAGHQDIFRWAANHPYYGEPPPGMVPITVTGGISYTIRFSVPLMFSGDFLFEIIQSPENSLSDRDGLIGLINKSAAGDTILVEQLEERPYWGSSASDPISDPNPRLEAMLEAARRGARVRLLLDSHFDDVNDPTSNRSTCIYANEVAALEGINFSCALANPTGLGIHSKIALFDIDGRGYIHVGSINGTELSSKGNRELAVQLQSNQAYIYLAEMFYGDWPNNSYLPLVFNDFLGPAHYPLISEVLYDPYGSDDAEFIELVNPTGHIIDLSDYSLGDALNRDDFEDVRRFPDGTVIESRETVVIATTATAFQARYGFLPDFEILDSDPLVPDLIDDPTWGDPEAFLQLGNLGDEIILRDVDDIIVDAVGYGTGSVPGTISCPLVSQPNRSLERYPYWRDTDNCPRDFREWPFPNPGDLP